jgi:membrane protein
MAAADEVAIDPGPIRLSTLKDIAVRAAVAWSDRRASSKGAALALYTLFSLAPTLLLVTAMAGFFFNAHEVRDQLINEVRVLVGDQGASAITTLLDATQEKSASLITAIISLVVVLVSATTAFGELKNSLDDLWQLPPAKGNGVWLMIRERFLALGVLLVLTVLLLFLLVASTLIAALQHFWGQYWQHAVLAESAALASTVLAFVIIVVLFSAIYKLLPNTPIAWRDVLPGALFTAVLFTIGKAGIGLYLTHGGVSTAYGAAGSFIALILWVYYSAQIFFYGALLTHEWTFTLGSRRLGPRQVARVEYVEIDSSGKVVSTFSVHTGVAPSLATPVDNPREG